MNPLDADSDRLNLLRESLPYIRRFKGLIFVIKLSGHVAEDGEALLSLAEEIALLDQVGFRLVLVHGGGRQLDRLADKLGIQQRKVGGLRVTDSETLEVAKMVFAGQVNTDIRSTLRRLRVHPIGLSGLDGSIVRAKRREIKRMIDHRTGQEEWVDFGHVGDIVEIDGRLLHLLLGNGYVPVLSSLGADDEGNVYNINADSIAAEVAVHLGAEKLILLSNVDGVYRDPSDPSTKIDAMSLAEVEEMLNAGNVQGGMVPKLMSIANLLKRGVQSAHIVNGGRRNALLREIFTDRGSGTMIAS